MSVTSTAAPSAAIRSAVARPIPAPAPVITANSAVELAACRGHRCASSACSRPRALCSGLRYATHPWHPSVCSSPRPTGTSVSPLREYRDYLDPEYREPFAGFLSEHVQRWSAAEPTSVLDPAAWDWWKGKERFENGGIDCLFDPELAGEGARPRRRRSRGAVRRRPEREHRAVARRRARAGRLAEGVLERAAHGRRPRVQPVARRVLLGCAGSVHRRDRGAHARRRRRRGRGGSTRARRRSAPWRAAPPRLRAARAPPEERAVLERVLRARPHHRRAPRRRLPALGG